MAFQHSIYITMLNCVVFTSVHPAMLILKVIGQVGILNSVSTGCRETTLGSLLVKDLG